PRRCRHLLLVVFLCCGRALARGLHPFPTRRSSDLRARGSRRSRTRAARGERRRSCRGPVGEPRSSRTEATDAERATAMPGARGIDRKSTRLNSSHVKISYAVFCLKKKTKTTIKRTT